MIRTRFTEITGINYPIMQGGMMWVSRPEFVAAVSNAGGLGTLPALMVPEPSLLSTEIKKIRKLTQNPFAINMTFLPTLKPVNYDAYVDVIINEGVRIVETAGNNPEKYMERLKSAGITVIHKCTSVRFARKAESIGCDIVSMDGFECAGHTGEEDVTSLVLIPAATQAVEIPVIGSGGFGDGKGLVAALALGGEGINMGTRFMMTKESPLHQNLKNWLLTRSEKDTTQILRKFINTTRVIKNSIAEKVLKLEQEGAAIGEVLQFVSGKRGLNMIETGDRDEGIISSGQVVGLIHDIPTVKELIDRMMKEAEQIIAVRLKNMMLGRILRKLRQRRFSNEKQ